MSNLKTTIKQHLQNFQTEELRPAALGVLNTLGYASDKTMELDGSPAAFLEQFNQQPETTRLSEEKALSKDWKEIQLLFQLTDQELSSPPPSRSTMPPSAKTPSGNLNPKSRMSKRPSPITSWAIETFVATANDPKHLIRQAMERIESDSPDLFAVIKQEGNV